MPVYLKQTWVNGPGGNTPLSAERLQHIEDGIAAVETALVSAVTQEQVRAEGIEQQTIQAAAAETTRAEVAEASKAAVVHTHAETDVTSLVTDLAAKVPSSRSVNGHTLSTDVTVTKADVGLGSADNTSDANKPVSTAQATALAAKADLVSGLVPLSQIPPAAFDVVQSVATVTQMLALSVGGKGALVRVADDGTGSPALFLLPAGADPTDESHWVEVAMDAEGAAAAAQTAAEGYTDTKVAPLATTAALAAETTRAQGAETTNASGVTANATAISNETTRAIAAELARLRPRGAWVTGTAYAVNDEVVANGTAWRCVTAHTSGATFSADPAKWERFGVAQVASGAPTSPATDDLWYDKTNDLLKRYNGSAWVVAGNSVYPSLTTRAWVIDEPQVALGTAYTPAQLTGWTVRNDQRFLTPIPTGNSPLEQLLVADVKFGDVNQQLFAGPVQPIPGAIGGSGTWDTSRAGTGVRFTSTTNWSQDYPMEAVLKVPNCFASVRVEAIPAGGASGVSVGFHKDNGTNRIVGYYDGTKVQITQFGSTTTLTNPTPLPGTGPFTFALILEYPEVRAAFIYDNGLIKTIGKVTLSNDLRAAGVMDTWAPFFGFFLASGATMDISRFSSGYLGAFGFRDPRLITYKDGTPFMRDGKYWFTFTKAGGSSYQTNSMGVASFDPVTYRLQLVSNIYWNVGGLLTAMYSAHCIYDEVADSFAFYASSFGYTANGTKLYIGTTTQDPTRAGVYILNGVAFFDPNPGTFIYYDAALRWDATAALWKLIVVEQSAAGGGTGQYYPTLWTSPDLVTWTKVASDTAHGSQEGLQWAKIGGVWYILTAQTSTGWNYYDASLSFVAALSGWFTSSTMPTNFTSPPPHPAFIPIHDDTQTRYVMVTFDYSGLGVDGAAGASRGGVLVLEASQVPTGHEFPRRRLFRASA